MGFEAKETIKWYEQFDNTNLVIKNNFKDINIKILKITYPIYLAYTICILEIKFLQQD